jgi:hypothetical protein
MEPGGCALDESQREAVEWLVGEFPSDRLPIVYSDDTLIRIRMRYYARTPWTRRRESHCVLYYSKNRERLRAWGARGAGVVAGDDALLALPGSAERTWHSTDLASAVTACRESPIPETVALRSNDELLDQCRTTPPRFDSRIEVLGLGGIDVELTGPHREDRGAESLMARAFFVTAGTSIESVAILLQGPDGGERTHLQRLEGASYSHEFSRLFPLPERDSQETWVLTACMVDSEGFAATAASRLTLR